MKQNKTNFIKITGGFLFCLLIRLIPGRPPNIEPIMGAVMPMSKRYGAQFGFIFSFLSIIVYDLATNTLGTWSFITASAYGLIGLLAGLYFQKRKSSAGNYALFAIFATLLYDGLTGLTIGPIFFHQPFILALSGQIPFTLAHLAGNITLAVLFSPAIYKYLTKQKSPVLNFAPKPITMPYYN